MPDVYVQPTELAELAGLTASDPRLVLACVAASQWVAARVGSALPAVLEDADIGTLTRVTCDVRWTNAARIAALRFLRSSDAPFGVMGGLGDLAVRVAQDIPEAKLALQGARTAPEAWGIG
jgi:hypothetical protein